MKRKDCFWIVAVAVLLLSSCSSSKKFVYLQDMEMGLGYPYDTRYEAVVHANDRLDITVSNKNPSCPSRSTRAAGPSRWVPTAR